MQVQRRDTLSGDQVSTRLDTTPVGEHPTLKGKFPLPGYHPRGFTNPRD